MNWVQLLKMAKSSSLTGSVAPSVEGIRYQGSGEPMESVLNLENDWNCDSWSDKATVCSSSDSERFFSETSEFSSVGEIFGSETCGDKSLLHNRIKIEDILQEDPNVAIPLLTPSMYRRLMGIISNSPTRNDDAEAAQSQRDLEAKRGFHQSVATCMTSAAVSCGLGLCKFFDPDILHSKRQQVIFYSSSFSNMVGLALALISVHFYLSSPNRGANRFLSWAAMTTRGSLFLVGLALISSLTVILPAVPTYVGLGICLVYAICSILISIFRYWV